MSEQRRPSGDEHWSRRFPDRVRRGEKAGAKLTPEQVEELCLLRRDHGYSSAALGELFDVSRYTIWRYLKAADLV